MFVISACHLRENVCHIFKNHTINKKVITSDNIYYAPKLIKRLLVHYMGVLSLWCGIPFKNKPKKRDTNSHVDNWFRILKNNILMKPVIKVKEAKISQNPLTTSFEKLCKRNGYCKGFEIKLKKVETNVSV